MQIRNNSSWAPMHQEWMKYKRKFLCVRGRTARHCMAGHILFIGRKKTFTYHQKVRTSSQTRSYDGHSSWWSASVEPLVEADAVTTRLLVLRSSGSMKLFKNPNKTIKIRGFIVYDTKQTDTDTVNKMEMSFAHSFSWKYKFSHVRRTTSGLDLIISHQHTNSVLIRGTRHKI